MKYKYSKNNNVYIDPLILEHLKWKTGYNLLISKQKKVTIIIFKKNKFWKWILVL